jgi:3-carboxy-cis,cis-muconate cycloisomerase
MVALIMSSALFASSFSALASTADMRALVAERARVQRLLDFVVALARAQAAVGVVPTLATDKIAEAARAERYDAAVLAADAAGGIAAALISALTAEVARSDAEAARVVGFGASEQDALDTALALELRDAIDLLTSDLNRAIEGFTQIAGRHRRTAAVGRVGLQQALPIPFGLKVAGYAAALARSRERLRRLRKEALALQFGGVAGTLAALGENGLKVSERLAALLDLPLPEAPYHGHSDRVAEVAGALAILAGTCGKIARDITLLGQTEIAEAAEPSGTGAGGRRRLATAAASAATLAPGLLSAIVAGQMQEHEGAVGGSQAQWQVFPALLLVTAGALGAVADVAQGLEIDAQRMRENLDHTQGLIMAEAVTTALAAKIGRDQAARIIHEAGRRALAERRHLSMILGEDPRVTSHMTPGELARAFELLSYQGVAQTFIDRIVGSLSRSARRP